MDINKVQTPITRQIEETKAAIAEIEATKEDRSEIMRLLASAEKRRLESANDKYRPKATAILKWLGKQIEQDERFGKSKTRVYIDGDLTITEKDIRWKDEVVLTDKLYVRDDGAWQAQILATYPQAELAFARDQLAKVKSSVIEEDSKFSELLAKAGVTKSPALPKDYVRLNTRVWSPESGIYTVYDYDLETDHYLVGNSWLSRAEFMTDEERKAMLEDREKAAAAEANEDTAEIPNPTAELNSTVSPAWERGQFYDVDIDEMQELVNLGYRFEVIGTGTSSRPNGWGDPYPVLISRIRILAVPTSEPAV